MFAGTVSVRFTLVAVLGPLLVTTCVYVIVAPAATGTGLGTLVTDKSAVSATTVFTVALLFPEIGSPVVDDTESVCASKVPFATLELTVTMNVKFAVVLAGIAAPSVHRRDARTQVHPAGPVKDIAVVPAGTVSVNTGAAAEAAPALVTL